MGKMIIKREFEYKVISAVTSFSTERSAGSSDQYLEDLDREGKKGWELAGIMTVGGNQQFIFKREYVTN